MIFSLKFLGSLYKKKTEIFSNKALNIKMQEFLLELKAVIMYKVYKSR